MKFGEKIKKKRTEMNLSQAALAGEIGVSTRTIQSYEAGNSHPKQRELYKLLADALDCELNYLLTEDEEFISTVAEQYGTRGVKQAESILEQTAAMFAGGELSDEDQIAFLNEIQGLYLDSKKRAKKFTPKKYPVS